MDHESRNENETHDEYLRRIAAGAGVTMINQNKFAIPSSSGTATYTVWFAGRGDSDERLWECDCPAGRHGRECKHQKLVWDICGQAADEFGLE